jgi:protein-S-isoprenylcysteine O-methyltransferase Ste14
MQVRNQRAFAAGTLFLLVAVFSLVMSFNYVAGTPARMGPGFFPRMIAIILGIIAISIMLGAVAPQTKREWLERWDLKGLAWIAGSVVLFGALLPIFGLVVAVSALVIVTSIASPEFGWRGTIVNAIVLTIFCVAAFVYGINLQLPVWPVWFQ